MTTWDLESFYETHDAWEKHFDQVFTEAKEGFLRLQALKGTAGKGPTELKNILSTFFDYSRSLDKIYTFAHLRHDENVGNDFYKNSYERSLALIHQFSQAASWVEPSVLALDNHVLQKYLSADELTPYRFYIQRLYNQKKHILSDDKEEILSLAARPQMTARTAFSAFSNADLKFPKVKDSKGKKHNLTHGTYAVYMKSQDRTLRENAFKTLHEAFKGFENTICQLISGHIQTHIFNHRVRNYGSCLEAALSPDNIPTNVYMSLLETTRNNLDALHAYVALRKKILGVDSLHYWDMSVPLVAECDVKFTYDEACDIVCESVAILGEEYQSILRRGLKEGRWVDVYEGKGKRSGAYSSGCYDSMPYILMNFQGTLNDVLTLSHEAGHSMHSFLSNRKRAYHEAGYSIFVAEVASTFNEQLTYEYLLKKAKNKREALYILNQQIDGIRSTFFRQAMFADFEWKLHNFGEKDVPLTPTLLKDEYAKLNREFFGPQLTIDEELTVEFMRVPHFYYNYYVYQYATGIAAAAYLCEKVKKEGPKGFLEFLAGGGSDYPIALLQKAGVDMATQEPAEALVAVFRGLLDKLKVM